MNPTFDIRGEHAAMKIILNEMRKLSLDMRIGKFIDSYRIVQILDFLHTFTGNCHYEKEEKCLYPALLDHDIPWTADTINHLVGEHKTAHKYIHEIDMLFQEYLSGNTTVVQNLSSSILKYVELETNHIRVMENVVLPLCDRIFDPKKLNSMAADFKKIQNQNVGRLKYQEFYKLLAMLKAENEVLAERTYF